MQSVISRVHRLVTAPGGAEDASNDGPAPASLSVPASGADRAPAEPQVPPAAVAVTPEMRLAAERLQFAMLLGERKKAVAALLALATSLSPADRASTASRRDSEDQAEPAALTALAQVAVPALLSALVSDPRDTELMEAMLELLQLLVTRAPSSAKALLENPKGGSGPSVWGIEIGLQLLQDPSPWIRGPAIALVRAIQRAQPKAFASAVLECKEGLRRVLEVVEDRREHIRDAALQVLAALSAREKNAQQFLAFEDGFTRLFTIMEAEGLAESSTVVSDCLQIVNNMLRDNYMTQTLFLELPFLESHVPSLLRVKHEHLTHDDDDSSASATAQLAQRKRTLKLALQLVRFLVAGIYEHLKDDDTGSNKNGSSGSMDDELARRDRARKQAERPRIQSLITRQLTLMGAIAELVCVDTTSTANTDGGGSDEVLADVQLQALDLLELLSTGNGGNQIILVNLRAYPSRRSVLAELVRLDIALDESPVAVAATSLLDALFRDNESAKMALLQHVHAPPPVGSDEGGDNEASELKSAGRVLLDALIVNAEAIVMVDSDGKLSPDAMRSRLVSVWKATHRLASVLTGSNYCKELALRLPSSYDDPEAQTVAGGLFLSRCLRLLTSSEFSSQTSSPVRTSAVFQVHVAVLLLLIRWCQKCPKAVAEIVGSVSNLSVILDKMAAPAPTILTRAKFEHTQIRGLAAVLLGSCLEFLIPENEEPQLGDALNAPSSISTVSITRSQLLDIISKRVGLTQFTDGLVQFQQSAAFTSCARGSNKTQSSRMLLRYRAPYDVGDHANETDGADGDIDQDAYLFLLYDKGFTLYYRDMASVIQNRILSVYTASDEGHSSTDGPGMAGPSAGTITAYQDLIRMQDKQIHDLKQQLNAAHQTLGAANAIVNAEKTADGPTSKDAVSEDAISVTMATRAVKEQEKSNYGQFGTIQHAFEEEKAKLEEQLRGAREANREMETRLRGLSLAFEDLEREHQHCKPGAGEAELNDAQHSAVDGHILEELRSDLETERRMRRELEDKISASRSPTVEALRLKKDNEELRMQLESKQDEIDESRKMLEALTEAQSFLKKENENLSSQLSNVSTEGGNDQCQLPSNKQEGFERDLCVAMTNELQRFSTSAPPSDLNVLQLWQYVVAQIELLREEYAVSTKRVFQLEQAADAVFEYDRRLLKARIDQVENARQQLPVTAENAQSYDDVNGNVVNDESRTPLSINTTEDPSASEKQSASAVAATQLVELQELRQLLAEVEAAAKAEISGRDATISAMQDRLSRYESQTEREKLKYRSTVNELEDELARAFLARKEAERKSKAAVKELENEVARLFLSKVEMEKQLGGSLTDTNICASNEYDFKTSTHGGGPEEVVFASITTSNLLDDDVSTNNSAAVMDAYEEEGVLGSTDDDTDLLVLVASLEIECAVLRDRLDAIGGAGAVHAATQRSRALGAIVIDA